MVNMQKPSSVKGALADVVLVQAEIFVLPALRVPALTMFFMMESVGPELMLQVDF